MNVYIDRDAFITECKFRTSRSGGKGGQNVNKVETKVELLFDISASSLFTDEQKTIILEKLKGYISSEVLQVTATEFRSQLRNKTKSVDKAIKLIETSLIPQKERKPSKRSKKSKEERLREKRIISLKKEYRKRVM